MKPVMVLWLSLLLLGFTAQAQLPADSFFRTNDMTTAKVSPDGRYVVSIRHIDEKQQAIVEKTIDETWNAPYGPYEHFVKKRLVREDK